MNVDNRDEPRRIPIVQADDDEEESDLAETAAGEPEVDRDAVATEERDQELAALQDRLLRLQAEFQNYRKREARERAAAWARAKGDLIQKLLGALDDVRRVGHLDPKVTAAASVIDGVRLVERKLVDTLGKEGLALVGEPGEPFDPNLHEAIGVWPAPTPAQDGTIAAVTIPGYQLGTRLLRPAQVQVYGAAPDRQA